MKTKREYFEALREIVLDTVPVEEKQDELLIFIDKEIEALEKRKVSAQRRAEKKRAESDALTDQIYSLIGDDFITVDTIMESIDDEEITRNKVVSRLGKLVKMNKIEKELSKIEDKRRMVYRRIG